MINLSQILHSKPEKKSITSFIQNQTPPTISYSYTKTTAGKIFNFKKSIEDLGFKIGTTNLSCDCHVSNFRYEPVGHVVTRNLGIVENRKLRKLLNKGPSYRELTGTPTKKAVRAYKVQWAIKEKVDSRTLDERECRIIETVQARIDRLRKKGKKSMKKKLFCQT